MEFDVKQFIGLAGIPFIEQVTVYLGDQWRLPKQLMPIAALAVGAGMNVLVAAYLHADPLNALYVGLLAGFLSAPWHEIRKISQQKGA